MKRKNFLKALIGLPVAIKTADVLTVDESENMGRAMADIYDGSIIRDQIATTCLATTFIFPNSNYILIEKEDEFKDNT